MAKSIKITKGQIYNMQRATRRAEDIENGNMHFKHKVHKSPKQYNRREGKRVLFE